MLVDVNKAFPLWMSLIDGEALVRPNIQIVVRVLDSSELIRVRISKSDKDRARPVGVHDSVQSSTRVRIELKNIAKQIMEGITLNEVGSIVTVPELKPWLLSSFLREKFNS